MKKETYSFVDYLFHNEDNCPMLGICFYDEKILFGWEEDFGVRSYRFRVQLVSDQKSKHFDRLMRKPYEYELLDFVYTCDLKDFTYKVPANPRFDLDEQTNFDWEKLVSVAIPKRLEEAKNRLKRKYKRFIPKPVIYEKGGTGYCHNNEFLWFTDESAYSWAGPFSLDEKKGCIMIAGINKHHAANSYPVLDVSKDHSFYDLPVSAKNRLFKHATGSNIHYVLAPEEKADLFRNLTDEEQYHTAKKYYNGWRRSEENLAQCLPYKIYLAGNDDCSYTKYFATEKEMNEEVKYLRKMQPLDFYLDVRQRGYMFTN